MFILRSNDTKLLIQKDEPKKTSLCKCFSYFISINYLLCYSIIIFFLFFSIYLFFRIGAIGFEEMFLGGPNRKLYCTDTNTPSLFFPINITQDCPNHTKLNLTDFYIPQSSYKTINFTSRDPWWVKEEGGNLKGYLVQVNLSNPYIILSQ